VGALADALSFRLTDTLHLTKLLFRRGCDVVTRLVPISSELWGGSLAHTRKRLQTEFIRRCRGHSDAATRIKRNAGEFGCPLPAGWSKSADGEANALVVDVGLPYEIVTGLHGPGEERYFSVGSILEASEVVETIE